MKSIKFISMDGKSAMCPGCGKRVKLVRKNHIARHGHKFEQTGSQYYQSEKGNVQYNECPYSGAEAPLNIVEERIKYYNSTTAQDAR